MLEAFFGTEARFDKDTAKEEVEARLKTVDLAAKTAAGSSAGEGQTAPSDCAEQHPRLSMEQCTSLLTSLVGHEALQAQFAQQILAFINCDGNDGPGSKEKMEWLMLTSTSDFTEGTARTKIAEFLVKIGAPFFSLSSSGGNPAYHDISVGVGSSMPIFLKHEKDVQLPELTLATDFCSGGITTFSAKDGRGCADLLRKKVVILRVGPGQRPFPTLYVVASAKLFGEGTVAQNTALSLRASGDGDIKTVGGKQLDALIGAAAESIAKDSGSRLMRAIERGDGFRILTGSNKRRVTFEIEGDEDDGGRGDSGKRGDESDDDESDDDEHGGLFSLNKEQRKKKKKKKTKMSGDDFLGINLDTAKGSRGAISTKIVDSYLGEALEDFGFDNVYDAGGAELTHMISTQPRKTFVAVLEGKKDTGVSTRGAQLLRGLVNRLKARKEFTLFPYNEFIKFWMLNLVETDFELLAGLGDGDTSLSALAQGYDAAARFEVEESMEGFAKALVRYRAGGGTSVGCLTAKATDYPKWQRFTARLAEIMGALVGGPIAYQLKLLAQWVNNNRMNPIMSLLCARFVNILQQQINRFKIDGNLDNVTIINDGGQLSLECMSEQANVLNYMSARTKTRETNGQKKDAVDSNKKGKNQKTADKKVEEPKDTKRNREKEYKAKRYFEKKVCRLWFIGHAGEGSGKKDDACKFFSSGDGCRFEHALP